MNAPSALSLPLAVVAFISSAACAQTTVPAEMMGGRTSQPDAAAAEAIPAESKAARVLRSPELRQESLDVLNSVLATSPPPELSLDAYPGDVVELPEYVVSDWTLDANRREMLERLAADIDRMHEAGFDPFFGGRIVLGGADGVRITFGGDMDRERQGISLLNLEW